MQVLLGLGLLSFLLAGVHDFTGLWLIRHIFLEERFDLRRSRFLLDAKRLVLRVRDLQCRLVGVLLVT